MTEVLQSSPYRQIHCQRKILDIFIFFIFCRSEFGRDEHSALSPLPATTERDHHLVQYARFKPIAFQAICFQPRCWEKVQTDQSEQCPSVYVYDSRSSRESSIPWLHSRLRHERRRGFSRNATFSRTLTYRLLAGS